METNYITSDCNFTSVSQRKPNPSSSHQITMPVLPKINLINTNWQEISTQTGLTSHTFVTNSKTNEPDKDLMPPPNLVQKKQTIIQNAEIEFKSWKPYINSKLNISIKGFVNNNTLEQHGRSVIERISNVKLKDSKGVIYILHGPCVEDELPEYIKTKFQNGFPKDWQAVKEIWIDFIKQHKSPSFRWPQKISDNSDDFVNASGHSNIDEETNETVISVPSDDNEENRETLQNRPIQNDFNVQILSDIQLVKPRSVHEANNDVRITHNKPEVNKKSLKVFIHDLIEKISEYMSDDESILITKNSSFISKGVQTSMCQNERTPPPEDRHRENSNDHDDQATNENRLTNENHTANSLRDSQSSPECMGVPSRTNFTLTELKRPKSNISSYREFKRQRLSKARSKSSNNTQSHTQETQETQNIKQVPDNPVTVNSNNNEIDSSIVSFMTNKVSQNEKNSNYKKTINTPPSQIESDEYTTFSQQLINMNIPLQQKCSDTLLLNKANILAHESTPNIHHNDQNTKIDTRKSLKSKPNKNTNPIDNIDSRKYDNNTDNDPDTLFYDNDKQLEPSNRTIILGNTVLFQYNQTKKEPATTSVREKENEESVDVAKSAHPELIKDKLPVSKRGRILSKPLEYWKGEKLSQIIKNGTNETKTKCSESSNDDSSKPKTRRQTKSIKKRDDTHIPTERSTSGTRYGKRKLFSHNFEEDAENQWTFVSKRSNIQESDFSHFTDL